MEHINHAVVAGNLTRDPELRSTGSGTSVCSLRIASNARRKDSSGEWVDKPNYLNVTVWGGQGENVAKHLSKGSGVVVSGRLDYREWEDKEGNKRQSLDVIAERVQFTGSPEKRDQEPKQEERDPLDDWNDGPSEEEKAEVERLDEKYGQEGW